MHEAAAFDSLYEHQRKEVLHNDAMCLCEDLRNFKIFQCNQYIVTYSCYVYSFLWKKISSNYQRQHREDKWHGKYARNKGN